MCRCLVPLHECCTAASGALREPGTAAESAAGHTMVHCFTRIATVLLQAVSSAALRTPLAHSLPLLLSAESTSAP